VGQGGAQSERAEMAMGDGAAEEEMVMDEGRGPERVLTRSDGHTIVLASLAHRVKLEIVAGNWDDLIRSTPPEPRN
jgi:hypothetical protein